ncbi:MAG: putative lipid II flippase FtsW [Deltaproteobacteria bacterium]|nr:putative lipid II flippase FtsW [Deltaproteobacteria bacterium]
MTLGTKTTLSARFAARWATAKALVRRSSAGPVDNVLAAAVIALIGFGIVMVYSSSAFEAAVRNSDPQFYVRRQAAYGLLALGLMWLGSRIDYRLVRPLTYPVLIFVTGLLVATVIGFGKKAGNAYRWLQVGPINVQPSEMAKVALVLWLAYSLSKKAERVRSFKVGLLPHLVVVGFLMILCLRQPDFGSAAVLAFITGALLFIAGGRVLYLLTCLGLAVAGAVVLVKLSPYRMARWMAFSDMDAHRQSIAYQPFQSVMSFGSGGIFGNGLGRGYQVLYLPEAHTDFVSAIIGEELGFVGILALMTTYAVIVWRGIKIALEADDDYGSFIAFGLAILLGTQVLLNLSVAMAIMPTKGLTLPFISYGGSSLIVSAASIGILLSISRRRDTNEPRRLSMEPKGPVQSASAVIATAAEEGT